MTPGSLYHVPLLRTALAAVIVADLLSFFFFLGDARAIALANGVALNNFNDLLSQAVVRGIVVLVGVAGAVAFGRKAGRLWEGATALGALIVLSTVHAQVFGSPWRHLFYSGVCLSGWLLGLAVSRNRGVPTDESYAQIGATALLGAAYLNAGISKIVYGGFDWVSAAPIQVVIIGQDGMVGDSIVSMYRSWVVTTPAVARLFSVATMGFELAGPLMIVGRRTRLCVALGLLAMHANVYVLTQILYWESMVFLVLFGLSSDWSRSEMVPERAVSTGAYDWKFVTGGAFLTICALLAIGHQSSRYAHSEAMRGPAGEPAPTGGASPSTPTRAGEPPVPVGDEEPPALAAPSIRQVGPFAVGQTLAEAWSIDSLSISDGGFVATLSGRPGRAAFEVTCASSTQRRSPFDLGAAHIFYSSNLEFHDLEAVGWALQAQVQKAAEGQDICERLANWRISAQAGRPR